jgi:hypothetical protein
MKRIFLTAAAIFALIQSYAQTDSSGFKSRKLKMEEMNLLSSYYAQEGDHASVTGGIGSQKLNNLANVFDIKLVGYDKKLRKKTLGIEVGFDHYTSASSDMVDLQANSSASHEDNRFYPSATWGIENEKKGTALQMGLSFSIESDYQSYGGNISFSKKTKNKNGEFTAKLQTYLDRVALIEPVELRTTVQNGDGFSYPYTSRNTFAASLSYSQVINKWLQVMILTDFVEQNGYLSLPFHRVYFNDSSVHKENLPRNRFKLPLAFRANCFLGDKFIIRSYYRYYTDDWGLTAHTADIEIPVKITPFFSVSPFYRYYKQAAANYFNAYRQHTANDPYYSSNYDLSKFTSNYFGAGIRLAPPSGIFGWQHLTMLELRYGHYGRNDGLNANIISLSLKYK